MKYSERIYDILIVCYLYIQTEMENLKMNEKEDYGSRIKELRIKMNLTQADVAKALNVTPGYISNVENNRTAMSLRILIFFAQLMHVSLDSLVGQLEPAYQTTALDNELLDMITALDDDKKKKLIKTIRIWS